MQRTDWHGYDCKERILQNCEWFKTERKEKAFGINQANKQTEKKKENEFQNGNKRKNQKQNIYPPTLTKIKKSNQPSNQRQ